MRRERAPIVASHVTRARVRAQMVRAIRKRDQNSLLSLRVAVDGGGCSGFQYKFSLVEKIEPDDTYAPMRVVWLAN